MHPYYIIYEHIVISKPDITAKSYHNVRKGCGGVSAVN